VMATRALEGGATAPRFSGTLERGCIIEEVLGRKRGRRKRTGKGREEKMVGSVMLEVD